MSEASRHHALGALPALAISIALGACVVHSAGLEVAVTLDLEISPRLRGPRLTVLELLPCPGASSPQAHHHGDALAPWSLPLTGESETALLTPTPGRYCDLRLQLEADEVAPRQAVVPLLCDGQRVDLTLSAASLADAPVTLEVSGSSPTSESEPMQRQLDGMLPTLSVEACPP